MMAPREPRWAKAPNLQTFGLVPGRGVSYCLGRRLSVVWLSDFGHPLPRAAVPRGAAVQDAMLVPFDWYTVIEIGTATVVVVLMVLITFRPPHR